MNDRAADSDPPNEGDWPEHKRSILEALKGLHDDNRQQNIAIQDLKIGVAVLSTKITLYAAAAGAGVALVVSVVGEVLAKVVFK